jgi:chloramphenicol 3-O-phosphotransferase
MTSESPSGVLLLLGGPAGAGKSTLARAWCATRARAVHVQLDEIRHLIVAGRADPQQSGSLQSEQYTLSVRASLALTHTFIVGGYDVAVDDVLEPAAFKREWRPLLQELDWRVVIVLPELEEVLRRSRTREKRVLEAHTRAQHAACAAWPPGYRVDTTGLTVEQSLALVRAASST